MSIRRLLPQVFSIVLACIPAIAQTSQCDAVLKQGIFDESAFTKNTQLHQDLEDYIYRSDFKTHAQANQAGFSFGVPIYGVPLQIGGTFSNEQREAWKSKYKETHKKILDFEEAQSSALKQVDSGVVNAWLGCISITSSAKGLTAGIQPSGKDYVYFWVRYQPPVTGDSATISLFQPTGVADKNKPIKVGQTIPVEAGGLGGLYRVTDPANVSFLVQATNNGQPRGTVAPHFSATAASVEQSGTFASGGPIVGEIRAIAFGGNKTDSAVANLRKQGWLECMGQPLNVLQYPELYDVIRETWGSPAVGVAFNAPNLSGQFLRGWNHATAIPTPNQGTNPNDGLTVSQNPSNPGDPDVATRVASLPGGAAGDQVGSFQDAHLEGFPHTIDGQQQFDSRANPPAHCCANYVAGNPHEWGFNIMATDSNAAGHDIAPKNVYVMYVIYVGRPVLDTTP
jgi:microcystin-dependent protein